MLSKWALLGLGSLLLSAVVGWRGENVGTDTLNYIYFFSSIKECACFPVQSEPIFGAIAWGVASLGFSYEIFFFVISLMQMSLAIAVASVLGQLFGYEKKNDVFVYLFFSILLLFPFFLSAQINVLRQGVSSFAVVLSFLLFYSRRWKSSIFWGGVAVGFHYSAAMYLILMPLVFIQINYLRGIFLSLVVLYVVGLTEGLVSFSSSMSGLPIYAYISSYGEGSGYDSGVRLDFLAFSLMPLLLPFLLGSSASLTRMRINLLQSVYLVLLVPFLLFGWAAYSDRYAFGAWLLMPAFAAIMVSRFFKASNRISSSLILALAGFNFLSKLQ